MSAYGPALFISRKDRQPLPKAEQRAVVALVKKHAKLLALTDDEGAPVKPWFNGYGEYEQDAVAVLIFSSYVTSHMPDDIRAEHEAATCKDVLKIGKAIDSELPGVYRFKAYYVED